MTATDRQATERPYCGANEKRNGFIKPSIEQQNNLRLIIDALTKVSTVADVRAALSRVACTSSDKQLKIYLAPVRELFVSAALHSRDAAATIKIRIERQPYKALMAYCQLGLVKG